LALSPYNPHPPTRFEMTRNSFSKSFPLLFAAACSASALNPLSAQADSAPMPSAPLQKLLSLQWTTQAGMDYILNAVPPPPAPGSDEEKADFQAVLKAQAARRAGDTNEIQAGLKIGLLTTVLSPDFIPRNYPLTFAFLGQVQEETRLLNDKVKARYQRHRPYQDHPEIKNLFAADSFGYPSEFAADSRMLVLVLSELFPFKAGDLLHRDLVLAPNDVQAGVAYPSDIIAGRALAHAFLFVIQDNPDFKHDLARAQAEIAEKTSGAVPGK
jgi:acid phosphatase (class A)